MKIKTITKARKTENTKEIFVILPFRAFVMEEGKSGGKQWHSH